MKRILLLGALLFCAGCSQSVAELKAKRDQLQMMQIELSRDVGLLSKRMDDSLDLATLREIEPMVTQIRGSEPIDSALKRKRAELEKVNSRLASVEKQLQSAATR